MKNIRSLIIYLQHLIYHLRDCERLLLRTTEKILLLEELKITIPTPVARNNIYSTHVAIL